MPDRYGEPPDSDPGYDRDAIARIAALAAERAIAGCDLCDDDGYRGGAVCDHIDHSHAAKRGMALIRATMGWKS
jgi:hypothetical protein